MAEIILFPSSRRFGLVRRTAEEIVNQGYDQRTRIARVCTEVRRERMAIGASTVETEFDLAPLREAIAGMVDRMVYEFGDPFDRGGHVA